MIPRRSSTLRAAFGPDHFVLLVPDGRGNVLKVVGSPEPTPEATASALTDIGREMELDAPRVSWALLPPLADVRLLQLPRLHPTDTNALMSRHVGRFFPTAHDDVAVAWQQVARSNGTATHLASAVPAAWLDRMHSSMAALGWSPADPVSAVIAWCEAARSEWPGVGTGAIAVTLPERYVLIQTRAGKASDVAMLPSTMPERAAERLRELAGGGIIGVMGEAASRPSLVDALVGAGCHVRQWARPEDAAEIAARFAEPSGVLQFVPPSLKLVRERRAKRKASVFWAGGIAFTVLAALADLAGAYGHLDTVRGERVVIASEVAAARESAERLEAARTTLAVLDSVEVGIAPWADRIAALAITLPRGAYLRAIYGVPDSVVLEGWADDASGAFAAVRGMYGVRAIRARGPIQREVNGSEALERFGLEVLWTSPSSIETRTAREQSIPDTASSSPVVAPK